MIRDLLDSIPLWGALLVTIGIVLVVIELGFQLGNYRRDKQTTSGHNQIVSMTGAHLGLLAFILAFSFSMSANHFSDRKSFLLEEVNAIQTAYLRANLVAEPERSELRSLLTTYTATRARAVDKTTVASTIARSEQIQSDIWLVIEQLATKKHLTVMDSLLVTAINDVFDLHTKRVYAGMNSRIPAIIWAALYVILVLSMIGMGFSMGLSGKRSPVSSMALALSFSMVMFVIADLDRPASGLVRSDQSIMTDLKTYLRESDQ